MATNRDLLKEAIADAKTVKETAIANAKAALEESFGPFLREKLAAKLEEIEEANDLGLTEMELEEKALKADKENLTMEDETSEDVSEISLDELLAEIEEDEVSVEEEITEAKEDESEDNEEMSIEDMTEEDLKSFIEGVIKDMVAAGELEAAGGDEDEEMDMDMDMEMGDEEEMPEEGGEEKDVNIDELLAELEGTNENVEEDVYEEEGVEEAKKKAKKSEPESESEEKEKEKELEEAYAAIKTLRSELQEINLLNAKLLYTNKLFRNKSLTESQKVKVLAAFDKAKTKQEAQLIYETLLGSVATIAKSPIKESLGSASKALGSVAKPIIENDAFARMRELAGLTKK